MKIESLEDFGEFLKEYRHNKRITQKDLEEITGVPQSRISLIERGVKVGFDNYRKIIKGLGLTFTFYEKE